MNRVSIIILSWNTKKLLVQCLRSLSLNYEIIVIDNASTDGSPEMIRKEFPKVRLICNKENVGFAKGNNQGVEIATGDLVLFLNSDTFVKDGAIEKLVTFFNKSDDIVAVSPLIINENGSIQQDPCYLHFPSPMMSFFYYNRILRKLSTKFFPDLLFSITDFRNPSEIDQLSGAALMIRRELFKKVGGFDENFPLYFEDTDLSYRLRKRGYKLMVIPEAEVIHLGRKSIDSVIKKKGMEEFYYLNFNSLFLFCEKNYSKIKTFIIKLVIFLHLLFTLKVSLIKKLLAR